MAVVEDQRLEQGEERGVCLRVAGEPEGGGAVAVEDGRGQQAGYEEEGHSAEKQGDQEAGGLHCLVGWRRE